MKRISKLTEVKGGARSNQESPSFWGVRDQGGKLWAMWNCFCLASCGWMSPMIIVVVLVHRAMVDGRISSSVQELFELHGIDVRHRC